MFKCTTKGASTSYYRGAVFTPNIPNKPPLERGKRGKAFYTEKTQKGHSHCTPFMWWFVSSTRRSLVFTGSTALQTTIYRSGSALCAAPTRRNFKNGHSGSTILSTVMSVQCMIVNHDMNLVDRANATWQVLWVASMDVFVCHEIFLPIYLSAKRPWFKCCRHPTDTRKTHSLEAPAVVF